MEHGGSNIPAESHSGASPEVHGCDRAENLYEGDREHDGADAQDLLGISLSDTLVDDVGVECRQVQGCDGAEELQDHHRQKGRSVGAEIATQQRDEHEFSESLVRTPSSGTTRH